MAIPASLERPDHANSQSSPLGKLYCEHERLVIGTGTLRAFLLVWEIFGRSGLVDPLFISSPTRVVQAGQKLIGDDEFWNDLKVSGTEFILGYGAAAAVAIPLGLAIGLFK